MKKLFLFVAAFLVLPHFSFAAPITEDFESYVADADLNGGAGGFGWAANWVTAGTNEVTTPTAPSGMLGEAIFSRISFIFSREDSGLIPIRRGRFPSESPMQTVLKSGAGELLQLSPVQSPQGKWQRSPNCNSSASPAVCGGTPSGSVALSAGDTALVVNTTAVTADSQIFVTEDSSLGARLGVTCNTATNRNYRISARILGVSFTIRSNSPPAQTKACLSYWVVN